MATIRQRRAKDGTARFTVRIRVKGSPEQSATFRRRTDARKWARQIEAAITEGRHVSSTEARRRTLGEMLDRYVLEVLPEKKGSGSSRHAIANQYEFWRAELGDRLLSEITPSVIAECRDKIKRTPGRYGRPRGPATTNRYLAALSHCFTIASREWEWVSDNPVKRVRRLKEPRGRVRYLSDDERARLLEACRKSGSAFLYDLVVIALCTGAREGEILGLRWPDISLDRRAAVLKNTKNSEIRAVPLAGPAYEIFRERSRIRRIDTDLVFPSANMLGKDTRPTKIRNPWMAALKAAEIEDFRFHDLRHSCASYLAMNGATTHEIAEVLGHKTLAMVKRYAHLSESHTSRVLGSMVANVFGDSGNGGARRGDQ